MINNKEMYLNFLKEENYTKEDITYSKYCAIIKMHNLEVMKQIILDAKQYEMGFLMGNIQGVEVKRLIKTSKNGLSYTSIDWPLSLERKAKLISEGEIPLEKYKDLNGNITGDNGGINWLIYDLSETKPVFYWNRLRKDNKVEVDKPFYPLSLIKQYQIDFTPKNHKLLYRYKFKENVSYTKLGL